MRFLTDFADQAVILPLVFAIAIALAAQGWRRGAAVWLGVVFATFAAILALKLFFLACWPLFGPMDIRSPSGHVAAATVVSGGLAALLLRRRAAILPVAALAGALIGLSRLMLGVHSPAEVVLGAVVGLGGAAALLRFAEPVPRLKPARLAAIVVIVAALFHGQHLPVEATIRHTAFATAPLFTQCREEAVLPPSWSAQAGHPRLLVTAARKDVDGRPARTMTWCALSAPPGGKVSACGPAPVLMEGSRRPDLHATTPPARFAYRSQTAKA